MKGCGGQWEEMEQGGSYTWTCNKFRLCDLCEYKQKVKEGIEIENSFTENGIIKIHAIITPEIFKLIGLDRMENIPKMIEEQKVEDAIDKVCDEIEEQCNTIKEEDHMIVAMTWIRPQLKKELGLK